MFENDDIFSGHHDPAGFAEEMFDGWLTAEELGFDLLEKPTFKREAKNLIMGSNFLNDIANWRENVQQHVIFNDDFISHKGPTESKSYQVLFKIVDRLKFLIRDNYVPLMGVSFGKDSSCVLTLTMIAYGELKLEGYEPRHSGLILHTNTLIEQPEVGNLAVEQWNELIECIAELKLPVEMRLAEPLFASSFLGSVVCGRTLPTTTSSTSRNCSSDYKVRPGQKVMKEYFNPIRKDDPNAKPLLLLGVRDQEGAIRAASIEKFGGQEDPLAVTFLEETSQFVCYPIKDCTTETVWEILSCAGPGKVIPSIIGFERTVKVYADSAGECVFIQGDKSEQTGKACGVRHGCAICCASGTTDKSMDELLKKPEYAYLRQLSRVRQFIVKTHWDWNDRNIFPKSINRFGYATIKPEAYSLRKCRKILHALVTADALEQKRAQSVMDEIYNGELAPTQANLKMAEPQFQFVTEADIVKLEFAWGVHQGSTSSFEAMQIWNRVYRDEEYEMLEWVDDFEAIPKTPEPSPIYIYVGQNWADEGLNPGMRDFIHEMVLSEPDIAIQANVKKHEGDDKVYFTLPYLQTSSMDVNPEIVKNYVRSDVMWKNSVRRGELPLAGPLSLLRNVALSLAKGMRYTYHQMAKRAQWWRARGLYGDLSYQDIVDQKDAIEKTAQTKLLSRKEYILAIADIDESTLVEPTNIIGEDLLFDEYSYIQTDLFGAADKKVTIKFASPKTKTPKKRKPPVLTGQTSFL